MAINKLVLEQDGLVVGQNQLVASGGGITVGKNLVVQGNTYHDGAFLGVGGANYSTTPTGYSKLTNGLHYMWGSVYANNIFPDVLYPLPFANAGFSATVAAVGSTATAYLANPLNNYTLSVRVNNSNNPANTLVYWTAIGA
jgi:hypothetical protein